MGQLGVAADRSRANRGQTTDTAAGAELRDFVESVAMGLKQGRPSIPLCSASARQADVDSVMPLAMMIRRDALPERHNAAMPEPSPKDIPAQQTPYGSVWTWDENVSENQKNLATFLKKLAEDASLQERIKQVQSQQEVIDIAQSYGIDFTVDTLESRAQTLPHIQEDELSEVRWGRWGEGPESRRWAMNVWIKL